MYQKVGFFVLFKKIQQFKFILLTEKFLRTYMQSSEALENEHCSHFYETNEIICENLCEGTRLLEINECFFYVYILE